MKNELKENLRKVDLRAASKPVLEKMYLLEATSEKAIKRELERQRREWAGALSFMIRVDRRMGSI